MKKIRLEKEKIYSGFLVLVNPWHALRYDYGAQLALADEKFPGIHIQQDAAAALQAVLREIRAGDSIVPVSGYRTLEEQTSIYDGCLRDDGEAFTKKYVALPNHSEHQVGLAIDLGLRKDDIDFIRPDFPYDGICQRFREKAPDFGFIERYPAGKESVTGTGHEPWHFRFVGFPHARIITDMGFTLEEYMDYIKNCRAENPLCFRPKAAACRGRADETFRIYYAPAADAEGDTAAIAIPDNAVTAAGPGDAAAAFAVSGDAAGCQISGNNMDGFIVTLWGHEDGKR